MKIWNILSYKWITTDDMWVKDHQLTGMHIQVGTPLPDGSFIVLESSYTMGIILNTVIPSRAWWSIVITGHQRFIDENIHRNIYNL